ncbi:MAG: hypothetical protein GF311_10825 [Candidatus Lokiarchaeota archaeon]|jgi:uncharacterized cupin superfamily protein|nr:hypothetical protein [Candidatus Lokiarchaeota archaeon]
MKFNLKKNCIECGKKEFYYGAKLNKQIKDTYLGMGYLEPHEDKRKIGPGKHHEEILCVLNGSLQIFSRDKEEELHEGEAFFLEDGKKIRLRNLTDQRVYFVIAGGHTKHHKH